MRSRPLGSTGSSVKCSAQEHGDSERRVMTSVLVGRKSGPDRVRTCDLPIMSRTLFH